MRHGRASRELDGDMDGADGVCREVDRCRIWDGGCNWLDRGGVLLRFVDLNLAIR